jgi:hypothetical protein
MMFIKTGLALYFAAIALAGPTPQAGIDGTVTSSGSKSYIKSSIFGTHDRLGIELKTPSRGSFSGGGDNGRTSCLDSCLLSTSLIRPIIVKNVGDTVQVDQVYGGAPVLGAPGIPGSTD